MLSDAEFAELEGVDPTQLEGDVNAFSMFTLPIGEKNTPLWSITPHPPKENMVDTKRRRLLRQYRRQGWAFDPQAKDIPDMVDDPQEE